MAGTGRHETTLTWQGGMAFDVELHGHHFAIDAGAGGGGQDTGPRPKDLLLAGLAGCTGMDFDSLAVKVDADSTEAHPKVYSAIRIEFRFTGAELDPETIRDAIELSRDRYCGVSAMLAKVAPITHRVFLNERTLEG
jgi:putative redox protein